MTEPAKNIVIIGGGFAGSTVARELRGRLPDGYTLILISEESYLTFNPMLPEVVGASIFPEQVVAPLRQMLDLRGANRFIMGHVTAIDKMARTVTCSSLAGETVVPYGELILAFGNRPRLDFIPGMMEHALPLKSIGDAMEIRNVVLRRLAQIELENDPERRRLLGHFVVIGGGFSGVEVAGELADCLKAVQRYYPRVNMDEVMLTVVQDLDRLLPELPVRLGQVAMRSLEGRGVTVLLGKRATEVHAGGIRCADGHILAAATVVCTIGTRPNDLVERLGLASERGRLVTRPDLSVDGAEGIWASGDCALVINQLDGKPAPPTAQFAVREARLLARNLLRRIADQATRPFRYRSRGMMAAIGHMNGVAEVFGIPVSGLPAWLIWRAYYLSQMPTFGRKLRIYVEWTWGMFFPTDITHFRFTRSGEMVGRSNEDLGHRLGAPSKADLSAYQTGAKKVIPITD
jgi:NADH:quinone reductase (non-electrogenic)